MTRGKGVMSQATKDRLAHELGFEDPAYFSRFFRRHTGQSPHRWRAAQAAGAAVTTGSAGADRAGP